MRLVAPSGDFWFSGFGDPRHDEALWDALAAEYGGEAATHAMVDSSSCPADLRLLALAMQEREAQAWSKERRTAIAKTPGPMCSRPIGHAGRHVALGERPHVVAAWPGAHDVAIADLTGSSKVLDDTGQAE